MSTINAVKFLVNGAHHWIQPIFHIVNLSRMFHINKLSEQETFHIIDASQSYLPQMNDNEKDIRSELPVFHPENQSISKETPY